MWPHSTSPPTCDFIISSSDVTPIRLQGRGAGGFLTESNARCHANSRCVSKGGKQPLESTFFPAWVTALWPHECHYQQQQSSLGLFAPDTQALGWELHPPAECQVFDALGAAAASGDHPLPARCRAGCSSVGTCKPELLPRKHQLFCARLEVKSHGAVCKETLHSEESGWY